MTSQAEIQTKAKEIVYTCFSKSYLKELYSGLYFATEYPEETDENGDVTQRKGNPIDDGFLRIDEDGLEELNSGCYQFVSLFEAALIIGSRVDPLIPFCLISESAKLFADACMNKIIDPRDPLTHIPYSKCTGSWKKVNNQILDVKDCPGMDWEMTLKEVAEFAALKGYPVDLFNDLITDNAENVRDSQETNQEKSDTDSRLIKNSEEKTLDPRERNTMLVIISALCEKFSITTDEPDLASELEKITERLGEKRQKRAIKKYLDMATKLMS